MLFSTSLPKLVRLAVDRERKRGTHGNDRGDRQCGDARQEVMIGGAPVTQAYADEVGADAYTPDAGAAAVKAAELVGA